MLDIMRPFTRAQALAAGFTDRQLAGRDFRRLLVGIYVSSRVPDTRPLRGAAALLSFAGSPTATATHSTAAGVYGAPMPADSQEHVTVATEEERRTRQGLRCHVAALSEHEVRIIGGLRVSSPERLFTESAERLGLVDLVVLGDWLVRWKHTTPERLEAHAQSSALRHAGRARRAAAYVRRDVDSPMETRLRLLLVLAGLPEPTVNAKLRDDHGTVILRLDLSWAGVKLAVEYDGRQHIEDIDQWERDVDRQEELPDDWRLIRITNKGIYREPERTIHRVWNALRDRGWRGLRPPTDGWRAHFRASRTRPAAHRSA